MPIEVQQIKRNRNYRKNSKRSQGRNEAVWNGQS